MTNKYRIVYRFGSNFAESFVELDAANVSHAVTVFSHTQPKISKSCEIIGIYRRGLAALPIQSLLPAGTA